MKDKGERNKRKRINSERSELECSSLESGIHRKELYSPIAKFNQKFESYYRLQRICTENEFQDFINSLSSPLPASLRANISHPLRSLLDFVLSLESEKTSTNFQGENHSTLKKKSLGKNCYSYFINHYSRETLKRESQLANLHNLIVSQDEFGTLSSQELVSMLPSIYLDPKPQHSILDLCSAPGSKSTQILDMILSSKDTCLGLKLQKGVFICNDVSSKRLDTLSSRLARLPSPNVIITCIDASFFPTFRPNTNNNISPFQFDRILVDSPCSGDGTLRKNPDIWSTWRPEKALSLHKKQISVLSRAFKLLKHGGRLVYSTCSLNPIENEAVISALLQNFPQAQLVNPSNLDEKEFIISRGLKSWGVYCDLNDQKELELFEVLDNVPNVSNKKKLTQSMFPTKDWSESNNFTKCFRVLPHKNDTGAFFFAIIEKKDLKNSLSQIDKVSKSPSIKYENVHQQELQQIFNFYGICSQPKEIEPEESFDHFPSQIRDHLKNTEFLENSSLVKKKSHEKTIYLIGEDVSKLIHNFNLEVDLRSVGIRAFEYLKGKISGDGKCKWRINQISSYYLIRLMKRRLIFVSVSILDLLKDENKPIGGSEIQDLERKGELLGLKEFCFENLVEKKLESGGILVVILPPSIIKYGGNNKVNPNFNEFHQGIILSGILYEDSGVNFFVSKNDIKSIKQLIFIQKNSN